MPCSHTHSHTHAHVGGHSSLSLLFVARFASALNHTGVWAWGLLNYLVEQFVADVQEGRLVECLREDVRDHRLCRDEVEFDQPSFSHFSHVHQPPVEVLRSAGHAVVVDHVVTRLVVGRPGRPYLARSGIAL